MTNNLIIMPIMQAFSPMERIGIEPMTSSLQSILRARHLWPDMAEIAWLSRIRCSRAPLASRLTLPLPRTDLAWPWREGSARDADPARGCRGRARCGDCNRARDAQLTPATVSRVVACESWRVFERELLLTEDLLRASGS